MRKFCFYDQRFSSKKRGLRPLIFLEIFLQAGVDGARYVRVCDGVTAGYSDIELDDGCSGGVLCKRYIADGETIGAGGDRANEWIGRDTDVVE